MAAEGPEPWTNVALSEVPQTRFLCYFRYRSTCNPMKEKGRPVTITDTRIWLVADVTGRGA